MKGFGSDNHAGVHPTLFQSLVDVNSLHAPSYGTDQTSSEALAAFKKHFGECIEVFFVFNGTAANVLSLRLLMKRHESTLCSELSHLNVDECGAPEFFAGKLIPLKQNKGKVSLATLKEAVVRRGDQHFSQMRVVSITQPTELGTCYSLSEIKEIVAWAHSQSLYVHMDGARLTNALVYLNCTYKELTTDLGVDVVSFGGTKNGLMMGEAILILNPELAKINSNEMKYIRKQAAQLPSKTRFIAAQFLTYLSKDLNHNNLNLEIARHSCLMAERLHTGLKVIPQIQITCERQSNAVFAVIPQKWIKPLREKYFFYVWNEKTYECRLMTSWDTLPEEVDGFITLAKQLSSAETF